ncbi:hypothetical protein AVEN_224507-1 [Araneus ventricosus]|uniref:Uncharacterized protein n=1 Tax=Araneus ventricosus TaxID=182803 RepID=A0A4Y2P552_ARAVE|nr:hypothetical protein AVEN_224507-1 [Araneus ventricosus]
MCCGNSDKSYIQYGDAQKGLLTLQAAGFQIAKFNEIVKPKELLSLNCQGLDKELYSPFCGHYAPYGGYYTCHRVAVTDDFCWSLIFVKGAIVRRPLCMKTPF